MLLVRGVNQLRKFGFYFVSASVVSLGLLAGCQTAVVDKRSDSDLKVTQIGSGYSEIGKNSEVVVGSYHSRKRSDPVPKEGWPAKDNQQIVSAFNVTVGYPMPLWYDPESEFSGDEQIAITEDYRPNIAYQRNQHPMLDGKVRTDEVYTLMLLNVDNALNIPVNVNEILAQKTVRSQFANVCAGRFQSYGNREPENTSVFFCELVKSPANSPSTQERSEIAVGRWFAVNGVIGIVFHSWYREKFDYLDETSWPVSQEEIDRVIEMMASVELVPINFPVLDN